MTVLAATDLDRTLIYSRKARALGADDAATVCVEVHDGEQVSFMTAAAAEALVDLAARAAVVPVTTRIVEQYRRVRLPGPPPKYAVVANGGVLLVDDAPDRGWARHIECSLAASVPLDEVWAHVGNVCHTDFTVKLRNASDLFCYAVVRPSRLPGGFVGDLSAWAAERGWRTSLQGRKLYWVPDQLTKSAAVAEVAARLAAQHVLAAGDSLLDVDLLLAADRAIRPAHGELHDQGWSAPHVTVTTASGIAAGAEIMNWFSVAAGSPVRA
ncbi:MAG TPA: HAD family hydrolase [Jatrophihabitans sp.]|jgi:hypothetical protein